MSQMASVARCLVKVCRTGACKTFGPEALFFAFSCIPLLHFSRKALARLLGQRPKPLFNAFPSCTFSKQGLQAIDATESSQHLKKPRFRCRAESLETSCCSSWVDDRLFGFRRIFCAIPILRYGELELLQPQQTEGETQTRVEGGMGRSTCHRCAAFF